MATIVLVHGSYDGGYSYQAIAKDLRAAGHEVYTPTLTGQGERVHLGSPAIGLDTHIQDVVNVLRFEKLSDVTLVGHSYGGMVITGVAEQVPELLSQLVYLDAFVPQDGQTMADLLPPVLVGATMQMAQSLGAEGWRLPYNGPDADRQTYLLLKTAQLPLTVNNPKTAALKHTYVLFTSKTKDDMITQMMKPTTERIAARVRQAGWNYREWPFEHYPMLEQPHEVARLLLELV